MIEASTSQTPCSVQDGPEWTGATGTAVGLVHDVNQNEADSAEAQGIDLSALDSQLELLTVRVGKFHNPNHAESVSM